MLRSMVRVVATLAIAAAAAADAPPPGLWDAAHGCIVDGVPGGMTDVAAEGQWQVLAQGPAAEATARRMLPTVRRSWNLWRENLGSLPDDGRTPYRIFFVPRATVSQLEDTRGFLAPICGRANHGALVVDGDEPDTERLVETVAHELFHAFQHASVARPVDLVATWWSEATAIWAMEQVGPRPRVMMRSVELFLDHPETPLDHYTDHNRNHAYSAWLFVRWLDDFLHCRVPGRCTPLASDGIWPLLRESFRRISAGEPATLALRAAVDSRAPRGTFDNALALFWAESLGEHDSPRPWQGPYARGTTWTVTGTRAERTVTIEPLAAAVVRIAVDAAPARVVVYAHGPALTRQRAFVLLDREVRAVSPSEYAGRGLVGDFCTTSASPLSRWPGQLPLSLTNTEAAPASWRLSVVVQPVTQCWSGLP